MITEFSREVLAQRGVKILVPGEKERVVVSLSDEPSEADAQQGKTNVEGDTVVTATAGQKCEVKFRSTPLWDPPQIQ